MFELIYPTEVRDKDFYIKSCLISTESGKVPLNPLKKINKFCSEVVPLAITKSGDPMQRYNGWYRPALRDADDKPIAYTCVWLDIDVMKEGMNPLEVQQKFEAMPHPPSIVVWSGGGFHLYWLLDTVYYDLSRGKDVMAGLGEEMGVKVDAQQLKFGIANGGGRIPGTVNWKWGGAPVEVRSIATKGNEALRYKLDDLPQHIEPVKIDGRGDVVRPKVNVVKAAEVFSKYFPEEDPTRDQWNVCCPLHEDNSPSLSINPAKGMWTCHSERHSVPRCGSAVSFYAQMEGISVAQAKRDLKMVEIGDAALVETLEGAIRGSFEPLYQDDDMIVGISNDTKNICTLNMGSKDRLLNSLANLFRSSPESLAKEIVGPEYHDEKTLAHGYRAAVHNLLSTIPSKNSLTVLGQGIHHIQHGKEWIAILVNGKAMSLWNREEKRWDLQDRLPVLDKYLPKEDSEWYPTKKLGSVRAPKDVYADIFELVNKAWSWDNDLDPHLICLFLCYVFYFGLFGRPLSIFLTGRSHSGKSAISEGLFAGTRHGSTGLVAGCMEFKETSLAGFFQSASHQSRLVVFDELYDSTTKHAKDIIAALRNLDAQNNKIVRGTKYGKSQEFPLNFPAIWSAIRSPELEQDANRQIFIVMKRRKGQEEPWKTIRTMRTEDDLQRIRAELPVFLMPFTDRLRECEEEINKTYLSTGRVEYRKGQQLLPLLQIAKVCGLDLDKLASKMTMRAKHEDSEIRAESFDVVLMTMILQQELSAVELSDGTPMIKVSIAEKISKKQDFSSPHHGLYYRGATDTLYISTPMLLNNWLGNLPRFRDLTERSLANLFRTLPGYVGNQVVSLGRDYGTKRCHKFNAETIMGILGKADEVATEASVLLT